MKGKKQKRKYEHIKRSEKSRGRSSKVAKRVAATTVNKQKTRTRRTRKKK